MDLPQAYLMLILVVGSAGLSFIVGVSFLVGVVAKALAEAVSSSPVSTPALLSGIGLVALVGVMVGFKFNVVFALSAFALFSLPVALGLWIGVAVVNRVTRAW